MKQGIEPRWVGWLYGDKKDREFFKSLGVHGPMVYKRSDNSKSLTLPARKKSGIFEHCWADDETLERLKVEYPAFYKSFSWVKAGDDYWQLMIARPELEARTS